MDGGARAVLGASLGLVWGFLGSSSGGWRGVQGGTVCTGFPSHSFAALCEVGAGRSCQHVTAVCVQVWGLYS